MEPLYPKTLYIFIHQNRVNPITMWTKCPKTSMVYNHFPPFVRHSITLPFIMHVDSLKSTPAMHFDTYSNYLLFFDLFWHRSQNLTKMPIQHNTSNLDSWEQVRQILMTEVQNSTTNQLGDPTKSLQTLQKQELVIGKRNLSYFQ
jgi:hypothetical protein